MQIPIDITFRDMTPSPALETAIREWALRIEHVLPLQRCAVVIEMPHKHRRHGLPFQVHLSMTIPGHSVSVTRGQAREPYLAVADAFRAARRQLLDFVSQRREARPAV
jgi:hypothetical protein